VQAENEKLKLTTGIDLSTKLTNETDDEQDITLNHNLFDHEIFNSTSINIPIIGELQNLKYNSDTKYLISPKNQKIRIFFKKSQNNPNYRKIVIYNDDNHPIFVYYYSLYLEEMPRELNSDGTLYTVTPNDTESISIICEWCDGDGVGCDDCNSIGSSESIIRIPESYNKL
jgi:hypothetical protein